jgi:hypothetical protein
MTHPRFETNTSRIFRNSTVGTVTAYGLDGLGLEFLVLQIERFSLIHVIETRSGAHPAFLSNLCRGLFFGGKATGA